jgi:hypothetical protein
MPYFAEFFLATYLTGFTQHISSCLRHISHRVYITQLIVSVWHIFIVFAPHFTMCQLHTCASPLMWCISLYSQYALHRVHTTYLIVFPSHISSCLRHIFYYLSHRAQTTYSPCSYSSHRIPTTYIIVFTLYISQCCFYIPHLTHYVSHRFRNTNGTEFSLPVSSCSRYVSNPLITTCSAAFTPRIPIVFPLLVWPCYHYALDSAHTAYY